MYHENFADNLSRKHVVRQVQVRNQREIYGRKMNVLALKIGQNIPTEF